MAEGEVKDSMYEGSSSEAPEPTSEDRPDYISEQHWDSDKSEVRVEALAKSFKDTQSALHQKYGEGEVPTDPASYLTYSEEGNIIYPEGLDNLPAMTKDDPLLSNVLKAAHEEGIPAPRMQKVLDAFFHGQNEIYGEYAFDEDAIYAELGESKAQSKALVDSVNVFLNSAGLEGTEAQAAAELMATAGGIKLLQKVISSGRDLPVSPDTPPAPLVDHSALETRWNELRNQDIRIGSPEYEEFSRLGNTLFKGKSDK